MTYQEAADWSLYINEVGSLNEGARLEQGFALVATLLSRLMGNKQAKMKDFMPDREQEQEATIEAVMGVLRSAQVK